MSQSLYSAALDGHDSQTTHPSTGGTTSASSDTPRIAPGSKGVLRILGTRGIPAKHGGFETFAEHFSRYMVQAGWIVQVYCQEPGFGPVRYGKYLGVDTVHVPSGSDSPLGTLVFDLRCVLHAAVRKGVCLTLGYNTAITCVLLRLTGRRTAMNMDGIEWKRRKWSAPMRLWLYLNEWFGAKLNHVLVADHPEIARHLSRHTDPEKIRTIPYGAEPDPVREDEALVLGKLGIEAGKYALVVARSEPENSILEIVQAWSRHPRNLKLVVLGKFYEDVPYHREVKAAANPSEVSFPGAIYEHEAIAALRRNAAFYVHGHQVGGTNPSLVEALSYGNPVLAHDNRFNRWVAGAGATYFEDVDDCDAAIARLSSDPAFRAKLSDASRMRHAEAFRFDRIHRQYEELVEKVSAS